MSKILINNPIEAVIIGADPTLADTLLTQKQSIVGFKSIAKNI